MKFWKLSNDGRILESEVHASYEVVYVLSLFHEPESAMKSDRTNHIECVPLQPMAEIDWLTSEIEHGLRENGRTFVHQRLKAFDRGHCILLCNGFLHVSVVRLAGRGKDVHERRTLVSRLKCSVKFGLYPH